MKKLQPDKLEPKSEKYVFIGYPKKTVGYTFYHRSEGKTFVAKNGSLLKKEFLSKEVCGRKVELDEVTVPSLDSKVDHYIKLFMCCVHQLVRKLMIIIMKLRINLLPNLVGQPEHVPHQSGTVILFWKSCYLTMTNLRTMKKLC